jgi:hypothetical protein
MRTTAVLFLLMLAAVAVPTPAASSASSSLVFTHAAVIDVRTGHVLRNQTIEQWAGVQVPIMKRTPDLRIIWTSRISSS